MTSVSKSQGVEGPSKVIKKLVQLPKDQPSDVDELLRQLKEFKVEDESYATTYFQLLAKDQSYMGILQPPAAYNPPSVMGQSSPVLHPVLPPHMCIFCHVTNCPSRTPRECPIRQEYVWTGKVVIGDHVFYRWPNGARIVGDSRGIKFVIDKKQQPAPAVQDALASYMQVDPASGDIKEWAEEEGVTEDELGNAVRSLL